MATFFVSDVVIKNPIFGNVDARAWQLSAESLFGEDQSHVSEWVAGGPAPETVRLFNSSGSALWGFPTLGRHDGPRGGQAVLFDGSQRIMTSAFSGRPQPHSVIVIARARNVSSVISTTARLWGSGAVNAPNLVVNANDTVSAVCGNETLVLPNNHEWMGFGLSWTDKMMTFVTSDSVPQVAQLQTPPVDITRNFIGGNNSAVTPNGLRGAISQVVFWDRALSGSELKARISQLMI